MNDFHATPRDQRNRRRYVRLLAAWALVFLASTFVVANEYLPPGPLRWLVPLLPSLVAAITVGTYWHYLREADELARTIELKALAMAVGAGFIIWPAATLLVRSGVYVDTGPDLTVLGMIAIYTFGTIKGRRDYR